MEKVVFVAAGEDDKKENKENLLVSTLYLQCLFTFSVAQIEIIFNI